MKKLTTEHFIHKAIEVHGDRYNYELVDYQGTHTKVKIICKQHGTWEQQPNSHLKGQGCPVCATEAKNKARVATAKSEFEEKASIVHNSKYTYELVDYQGANTKIKIICKQHGEFQQQPSNHLQGQRMSYLCFIRKRLDTY